MVDGKTLFKAKVFLLIQNIRLLEVKININKSFILFLFPSILLFGCSQKNNNIDLSNLPVLKPKEVVDINIDNEDIINSNNNEFIQDLVPYKSKEKVLSEFKFGKEDPFSESEIQITKLYSDFKLTGFLNTEKEKYVFVSYLGNEGIITGDSIGGLNTNLLPNGAKVIYLDTKENQLQINFNNEDYIFEF